MKKKIVVEERTILTFEVGDVFVMQSNIGVFLAGQVFVLAEDFQSEFKILGGSSPIAYASVNFLRSKIEGGDMNYLGNTFNGGGAQ